MEKPRKIVFCSQFWRSLNNRRDFFLSQFFQNCMTFRDILPINISKGNFCLIKIQDVLLLCVIQMKKEPKMENKQIDQRANSNLTYVRSQSSSRCCRNEDLLLIFVKYIEWKWNGFKKASILRMEYSASCCIHVLILRANFRGKLVIFDHDHNYLHVNFIKTSIFKKFKILSKRLFSMCTCAYRIELRIAVTMHQ